jgi:hypothetical protein
MLKNPRHSLSAPWTYDVRAGGPLDFDKSTYKKLMNNSHKLVEKFEIPIRTGNFIIKVSLFIFLLKIEYRPSMDSEARSNLQNPNNQRPSSR